MKQKDSLNKHLNKRLASLVLLSVLSVPWVASAAGNSVVANDMLPGNGKVGTVVAGKIEGGFNGSWSQGNQMNLHQTTQNAIVTWDSFSIGANASVTIKGDHNNFNMLNYVTGSESSQIYGKLNSYVGDKQGGNIYLVNPNGVQIGNSAEINVGSLHIANKKIDNFTGWTENTDIANALKQNKAMTNAELMSLGYINASKLVFEGERVVIDMDRLSGLDTTKADALTIVSQPYDGKSVGDNRKYDIVLGSSTPEKADEWGKYMVFTDVSDNGTGPMDTATSTSWHGSANVGNPDAPDQSITEFFTYRWIKDGKELEKIGTETGWGMGDHYALRYSIDLTGSDQTPIGNTQDKAFKGKFDGLDNSIFGLSINNSNNSKGKATGLFGFTDGAIMGNVTLIAGSDSVSIQGGTTDTGAFIGHAVNTTVKGVNSTLKVSGTNNVGGIIGYAKDDTGRTYSFADAAGSVQPDSRSSELSNLTNTGNVSGITNVGGLVGYMDGGKLSNDEENRAQYKGSYNLGKITGIGNGSNNIGGLIGKAENATVSGTKNTLINYNTVEGGYNVGGIVGSISNTTVANASNEGMVKANGFTIDSYIYHTDYTGDNWKNNDSELTGTHKAEVRAANVGGIVGNSSAGSELKDVTNKADVSSALVKQTINSGDRPERFDHYAAGNVGGIVGRAEDSNITNANNVESNIRGAMNVGGIAGYFGSTDVNNEYKKDYRILNAINNGGDIMATGGIKSDGSFTQEITRFDYDSNNNEKYITGNIGGIAGYLFGAPVRIEAAGNRGDVHTEADKSKLTAQAANVGGIVGKIDMPKATDSDGKVLTDDERLAIIKSDTSAAGNSGYANAVVSSSYNTGNVKGYTNIGGIGGFAYNGSIAASYNVGDINTTRDIARGTTPINMGGILGDSTEQASGRVIIYDTYNKGTIGDSSFSTFGRHVGGIVGRLSGIVEKSYNNGEIYNGSNVVGGIAGYWYSGYLKNVFNTGNITVNNKNSTDSQVGGIVGSVDLNGGNKSSSEIKDMSIANAYNIGSLRSFKDSYGINVVGGILGATYSWPSGFKPGSNNHLKISNAYTMGNLYVDSGRVGDILGFYGSYTNKDSVTFDKVYYIRPQADNGYLDLTSNPANLELQKKATAIDYDKLTDKSQWDKFVFSTQTNGKIEGANDDNWRMSNGASLPMLNAFLSGSHKYFSDDNNWQEFMKDNEGAKVQYGTAYDPLLTIINTKKDLSFNWSDMDLKNNGSLAVFGLHDNGTNLNYTPGLTLNNVEITNSTHIFGGTIYSDGLLELNAKDNLQDGLRFGMDSKLYGSDVVLTTNSSMELSGSVIATGNHNALSHFNPEKSLQHGININASDLTVYGKLITMGQEGERTEVIVPGINYGYGDSLALDKDNVSDKTKAMLSQGMAHAYKLTTATGKTGNITISTMEKTLADGTYMSGSANLLYGNYKKGKIETKGNLTVSSSGDILVDSDLDIAGRINLSGAKVPDGSGEVYVNDITLDLSNIGGELTGNDKVKALHKFIDAHATAETGIYGNNNSEYTDDKRSMKITFNLWDDNYTVNGVKGNLNFDKNDLTENGTTVKMADKLKNLYVESADNIYNGSNIRNIIYTWISNANELNSLQRVAENLNDRDALSYNYVLKNDIDASGLVNAAYNTIGRGNKAFTGIFDGNGHTIVGLQAKGGLFGELGSGAVVKNINIVSSVFTGKEDGASVGAVAAENNGGSISGISGYGNTVKGNGGYIGGLVGKNYGGISNSNDQSTVIAGAGTVAGGIAGVNGTNAGIGGTIDNVQSNSAVTTGVLAENQYASNLGGIVGKNEYNINNVSAHGVTGKTGNTQTSGGIVGTNEGRISNAYNESIIHGSENIGGVAGNNVKQAELNDVANAVEIIGDAGSKNVGGLVGMQDHATTNQGRNTGAITGCTNVGGMVGYNTADSYLNNLENSPQATITGITNVGGIAGVNEGVISADDQLNLVNSGKIYGWENVGGIAGKNSGKIDNVNSNINLYVIDEETRDALKGTAVITPNAQFFGGVTGENVGIITNATNRARVDAAQASYVGGIVGRNTSEDGKVGQLLGMGNSNEGFVIGKNYVGGVIGKNEVAIAGTAKQSVGIVNSGTVIALAGGAGGIIGENNAKINYVIMKNEGEVHGNASPAGSTEENGTGGIIGVNAIGATISNSSLMNRVNGNVSGVANVGGIIGINHGVITGGRDANNNYYKYQIYNNGTIQAGSYDATNGTITAFAGKNIGGLLGNNSGKLTAGYNTGVVDAGQSSNVGGIAGTNSGTLDQVFNSVVTVTKTATDATDADGKKVYKYTYTDGGEIRGAGNVGGIVGSNTATGTLSNAYSTTTVAGASNVANIVGSNAGHVSNIYGYAANGNNNVNDGIVRNSHIINDDGTLENDKDAEKLDSYDFDNKKTTWKLYDKRTNPLLKVFLTKVTVDGDLQNGWVYDATNHLDIPGWIANGKLTTNDADNDAFAAYKNNNSLLQGEELKNVGDYSSWLWSGQIASGGDVGPNNLGYDFTVGDITITKRVLNVTGNTVNRTYGDLHKNHDYALSIEGFNNFNDAMKAELNGKVTITDSQETIQDSQDTGIITVDSEKRTNNKGTYKWQAGVELDNSLIGNYEFKNDGVSSATTTVQGVSNVLARTVYLNDINANLTYGSSDAINDHINGVVSIKDLASAIVYGDNVKLADGAVVNVKDGSEYAVNKGERNTADVDTYDNSLKIDNAALTGDARKLGNYELVNNATGSITVEQAEMHVKLNDVERTYGNTALINGTRYGVNGLTGNVNGDSYAAGNVTLGAVNRDGAVDGVSGSKVTNDADDTYKWNANVVAANDKLKQNYKLIVDDGASVVNQATLQVSLNEVVRTYGNAAITSGSYSASGIEGLVNGDSYDASAITVNKTSDGAIDNLASGKTTNDAGNYEWTGSASTTNAGLDKNYNLVVTGNGKSTVEKAQLVVNLNDITRVYGNLDAKDYSNAYTFGENAGLVNGDNGLVINANKDGAITSGTLANVKKTNNVGSYEWNGTASGVENLNTNYDVTVKAGKSDVTKANLVVNLNDITRVYGNLDAKNYSNAYTFDANAGLVNGDNGLVINANKDGAITGGTLTNVEKTNNVGSYEWNGTASGVDNLNTNYDVTVKAGKSDVTKANLVVNLNDITRVYGNLDAKNYSNAYTFDANAGLVNGDNGLVINANKDGAITSGTLTNVKKTNNVGSYEWNGTASGVENLNTNYDVTVKAGKSDVTKANLVVNLNDITRVYGNLDAKDYSNAYTFDANAGLVNGDNGLVINANKDGAITSGTLTNVKKTNNVGSYEWNGTASGVENLNTNYDVTVKAGKSDVTKANLVVNLNDITRVYGNLDAKDYSNAFTFGNNAGLVNGDNGLVINANTDGAIVGGTLTNVEKTNNVGSYEWNGTASGVENLNNNYDLTVNAGKSDVTPAKLTFVVDDKTITQGVPTEYTGKANGLTNGDTLAGIGVGGYELDSSVNPLIVGVYEDKIGVLINGSVHLTGGDDLLKNYKVEIDPGTLTVLASFNPADDYWFGTAPWDKERNLRERKAEFHYVAGGMSL